MNGKGERESKRRQRLRVYYAGGRYNQLVVGQICMFSQKGSRSAGRENQRERERKWFQMDTTKSCLTVCGFRRIVHNHTKTHTLFHTYCRHTYTLSFSELSEAYPLSHFPTPLLSKGPIPCVTDEDLAFLHYWHWDCPGINQEVMWSV